MVATHVFDTPPPGVASDWSMPQNWERFSAAEHASWDALVSRQAHALQDLACREFLAGMEKLQLSGSGIPDLAEINPRLHATTEWQIIAVPGVIPNDAFFRHLAERRFPAANFLRPASSFDYSEEPDAFHDLFGHLPMLTDPVFADFMAAYGRAGLRAEALGMSDYLGRFYLHTVEFGLVVEDGALRAFGAGLLSSYSEALHAVTAPDVRRLQLTLPRAMRTDYLFDEFQKTYFVIESFDELLRLAEETDFRPIYERLRDQLLLPPDADCEDDVPCPTEYLHTRS